MSWGGGVGITAVYPVVKALKEAGNKLIGIIGARSRELVIFESEMKLATTVLKIGTDDGEIINANIEFYLCATQTGFIY